MSDSAENKRDDAENARSNAEKKAGDAGYYDDGAGDSFKKGAAGGYRVNTTIDDGVEEISIAQRAAIKNVIGMYDKEAKLWDGNARWALRWIFVCFALCLAVFVWGSAINAWKSNNSSGASIALLQNEFEGAVKSVDSIINRKALKEKAFLTYTKGRSERLDSSEYITKLQDTVLYSRAYDSLEKIEMVLQARLDTMSTDTALATKLSTQIDDIEGSTAVSFYNDLGYLTNSLKLQHQVDSLNKQIELKKAAQGTLAARIAQKNTKTDMYDFITDSSTRIGAILILVFMVQYLSRIHRYNKKLADYYAARANALRLHLTGLKDMNYHKIYPTISPDSVDLKFVKAPTDKVFDVIKAALESGGKMVSK